MCVCVCVCVHILHLKGTDLIVQIFLHLHPLTLLLSIPFTKIYLAMSVKSGALHTNIFFIQFKSEVHCTPTGKHHWVI